jgi:hypothetical protein
MRPLSFALYTVMVVSLVGCYAPDGGAYPSSNGTFTYYSTTTSPKTIAIVDARSEAAFFTLELPVGQQLTFKFLTGGGNDEIETPDRMQWELFDIGTGTGRLTNQMTVPPAMARRIQIAIRPVPEQPPADDSSLLVVENENGTPGHLSPRGGRMPNDKPLYDQ